MTPVLSANVMGSDNNFILSRRSFVYLTNNKNKGSRTDPWGTLCFNVPQSKKEFQVAALNDFISTSCFLLLKYYLKPFAFIPQMPEKYNLANKIS
jgi:hypothetical protein